MSRFVKPETVRYDLAPDPTGRVEWIEIKKRLNQGEANSVMTAGWRSVNRGQEVMVDWRAQTFARTVMYLVRWSFLDEDDQQTKPSAETIEALDQETFAEIQELITRHIELEAEARKNAPSPSATA